MGSRVDDEKLRELEALRRRVAELERVEEQLRESEARMLSMAEASPDHVMLLDRAGAILYINRTVPDLTIEQVLGRPVHDFMPPDQHAAFDACAARVHATGEPDGYETVYVAADGSESYFDTRVGPVIRDGEVVAMAAHSTDVTERRRRERALRDREAELDRFFGLSMDSLVIADTDGYFRRVNQAFADMLGYTADEILATPYLELIHEDDVARTRAAVLGLSQGESVIDFENRYRTKDGSWRLLQWSASAVREAQTIYAIRSRHHRAAGHRGPAAPLAEDGRRRSAGGGGRPRLQQPRAVHPGQCRVRGRGRGRRAPDPGVPHRGAAFGRARRRAHAPAAHVLSARRGRPQAGRISTTSSLA